MARYRATVATDLPCAEVFTYLSDFSNAQEWDPGTLQATRVGDGPLGVGSEFRLLASFLGRTSAITYRIVAYDPPAAVTFRGENASVISLDRVAFASVDGGTVVTYDARLSLKGIMKLGDPLLALAFRRVGSAALAGMREALARR